ncbi:uridine kinase [candidate division KSB3 bacterium]|uniref:uridine/cytidine kinase n=1 Tax=candidate division KSB3 bacterium TaxID=2044937 RepID=A0A2G6E3H6_9BACT|nr:MAG: uridine kinase [candidate division KSB3 bacterium]PIE28874.1 MAG: uridine kinase [candidate division KSB3 bacterium]
MIIGICGGTASGKTIFAKRLVNVIGAESIVYLEHDAYYLDEDQLPQPLQDPQNFDHPDSLDNDLFIRHIKALRMQQAIERPVYDFTVHRRMNKTVRILPKPIILIDGILILAIKKIRKMFDIKVFIDAPPDIRLSRRLQRDLIKRGRDPQSVLEQYLSTVRPMHKRYVSSSKRYADIIIHGKIEKHDIGLDLLITKIRAHLEELT